MMPKLKNPRHELFAHNYVAKKANATQAYIATYPDIAYDSARAESSALIANNNVKERCLELLEKQAGSRLTTLINDLVKMKGAQRSVVIADIMHEVADNPVRLEAIKTLIKMHGALSHDFNSSSTVDNRSITFNINGADINALHAVVDRLGALREQKARVNGRLNPILPTAKSGMGVGGSE